MKLIRLINISAESMEIAKEVISLIVKIPIDKVPLSEFDSFRNLVDRLSILIDGIVFSDETSLNELAQNNYEFLDTLRTVLFRLCDKKLLPNGKHLEFLIVRIDMILEKLNSPPFLQHREPIRRKFTEEKSDEDFTECDFIQRTLYQLREY